jgi:hypothetical protein
LLRTLTGDACYPVLKLPEILVLMSSCVAILLDFPPHITPVQAKSPLQLSPERSQASAVLLGRCSHYLAGLQPGVDRAASSSQVISSAFQRESATRPSNGGAGTGLSPMIGLRTASDVKNGTVSARLIFSLMSIRGLHYEKPSGV